MLEGKDQGIIDRGLAVGFDGSQNFFEKRNAVCEVLIEPCRVVKVHNEGFVFWIALANK